MSSAISVSGYERLHNILISLEMEISDSILSALSKEVALCRQEQKEQREQRMFLDPILIGIDTVIRHVDEIRVLPDARALDLLNELVHAYQMVTEELVGQQDACQEVVSASLQRVFAWQHDCIQEATAPAFGVQELLTTVQQEIATTGMLAIRESATLLELVYTQHEREKRDRRADQEVELKTDPKTDSVAHFQGVNKVRQVAQTEKVGEAGGEKDVFTSLIEENISSLQQIFHQELGRLRHDFIRE